MITESISSILARQDQNQLQAAGGDSNVVDKDAFLKLLVTQMQYQDPLSPMDNTQFLSQMAQFSTLEQMQNMNGNLTSGLQWDLLFNQTINNTMATSLIGREVEALGSDVTLGEAGKTSVSYELGAFAKDVMIDVVDASGQVIYSDLKKAQDAGTYRWEWGGNNASGTRLPAGEYSVRIRALDAGGSPVSVKAYRIGIVTGVTYDQGAAFLMVDGQRLSLGDIQRISIPGEA